MPKKIEAQYDFTQLLDPAWQVGDLFVTLNKVSGNKGETLAWENIMDYEAVFDGRHINGVLSFTDKDNLYENMPIVIGGFVDVSFVSQPDTKIGKPAKFEKKFVITKASVHRGDARNTMPLVEIRFKDVSTKLMQSSYQTNVYKDMKPAEAMKKHFESMGIKDLIVAGDPKEKETTLITPSHIDGLEYMIEEMAYRGYKFIQDRLASYLVHESHMTNDKAVSTGEVFEYKPSLYYTRFQVIEYNTKGFDINALEASIPSTTSMINNEAAQSDKMDVNVKETKVSSGKLGGVKATDYQTINGQKQSSSYNQSDEDLMKDLKNLQEMSIWVPGWNGNRIGMTVEVEMPRPVHIEQTESSESFRGKWVVNKVRDKIISSYFVQELFLSRSGD
jgi:hypothetical protein